MILMVGWNWYRATATHREGDLVIGKAGKTAVATLVECVSRIVVLVPLTCRDTLSTGDAVIAAAGTPPPRLARSLTRDCGCGDPGMPDRRGLAAGALRPLFDAG